jgi:hypothetical protein
VVFDFQYPQSIKALNVDLDPLQIEMKDGFFPTLAFFFSPPDILFPPNWHALGPYYLALAFRRGAYTRQGELACSAVPRIRLLTNRRTSLSPHLPFVQVDRPIAQSTSKLSKPQPYQFNHIYLPLLCPGYRAFIPTFHLSST